MRESAQRFALTYACKRRMAIANRTLPACGRTWQHTAAL